MAMRPDPPTILSIINTSGIVGVLVVAIWLGLRGDVVTSRQLADCQQARDAYLHEWIKAITPSVDEVAPGLPPWRVAIGETVAAGGYSP